MRKEVQHLTLTASLLALAVVLNIIGRQIVTGPFFGIPFFALPLVIASIILGPKTGALIGGAMDIIAFFIGGGQAANFLFLFTLSRMVWGFLPYFFYKKGKSAIWLWVGVGITHILVTTINTYALHSIDIAGVWATFPLRLAALPVNVVWISCLTIMILNRLPESIWEFDKRVNLELGKTSNG